ACKVWGVPVLRPDEHVDSDEREVFHEQVATVGLARKLLAEVRTLALTTCRTGRRPGSSPGAARLTTSTSVIYTGHINHNREDIMRITITAKHYDQADRELDQAVTAYMLEVEEYAADGFRPETCFHGTNLWGEADPMCGSCEDGEFDPRRHTEDSAERAAVQQVLAKGIAHAERRRLIL